MGSAGFHLYVRVGYGSYVDPVSTATDAGPQVEELSPTEVSAEDKSALTDNQCCAMPHPALINSVIPQQRSAYELQVRFHKLSLEIELLGALNRAELR